jgi:hypothetical protein
MAKKILLPLLALLVVACVLTSACFITGALTLPFSRATATAVVTPAPTQTIDQQMDQIQSQVLSYRGLELKTTLSRALMTPAELKDKVINEFFADYTPEDAQSDVEVLSALGLLQPGFDLLTFYQDLYAEQIAGYYDDKTKDMYVITGEAFSGLERMTYAHEFTHVLQDQNYDLENGLNLNDENCKVDTEYCAAVTALVEGDATLSEYYWFMKYGTDQDKQDVATFQQTYKSPVYDSAPAYMKEDFLFSYDQGYNFANYLYTQHQWQSIADAYANPPVSTEQILHPEKYPSDIPIHVDVPDMLPVLGTGWTEVERNVMGEWYTYLILADGRGTSFQLPKEEAQTASAGWGGDTYVYYNNPDTSEFAFVWLTQWDTPQDADEFFKSSLNYGTDRWGVAKTSSSDSSAWQSSSDGQVYMRQVGDKVLWLMSPSAATQNALLNALPGMK